MPISDRTHRWFNRFGFLPPCLQVPVFRPGTRLIVVIPALAEPDLDLTFLSLSQATLPGFPIDVIVVLNHSIEADTTCREQVRQNLETCKYWEHRWNRHDLRLITIYAPDLPTKHAGAGLSRKIGMDLAVLMADGFTNSSVTLACLDADCTVSTNYFVGITNHFASRAPDGASLYFEHPLTAAGPGLHRQSILEYELYLRYYIRGLRYAGYLFAYHTVGSSMAVSLEAYMESGGMNRRKAGEDFYFLHKIIPNGRFSDLTDVTVFPSPRPSWRVPFGTGRTMSDRLDSGSTPYMVYAPSIFTELRVWLTGIQENGLNRNWWDEREHHTPASIATFLRQQDFHQRLGDIFSNASTPQHAVNRFWRWADGFTILKLVHHLRDTEHGIMPVEHAVADLLTLMGESPSSDPDSLLSTYREMDKREWW